MKWKKEKKINIYQLYEVNTLIISLLVHPSLKSLVSSWNHVKIIHKNLDNVVTLYLNIRLENTILLYSFTQGMKSIEFNSFFFVLKKSSHSMQ